MEQNDEIIPKFDTSQFTMMPMSRIVPNEGQLPGLPENPRQIKKNKFDKLKENIRLYPEMLIARSLLVYPLDDTDKPQYIIIGGNMRYRAMSELHHTTAPVFIIPRSVPVERLQAYTILDNGDFGSWDWDLLANEWAEDDLNDWGVDIPTEWTISPDNCDDSFSLPSSDKGDVQHMGFVLSNGQSEFIKSALKNVQTEFSDLIKDIDGNSNKNGNALYLIVTQWAEQRK